MNSPIVMCSIVSPAFHIGLPGSPSLLLESYRPTDFSSNPSQTPLNQLITVFKAILVNFRQVCWSRGCTEMCRMVALQERVGDP